MHILRHRAGRTEKSRPGRSPGQAQPTTDKAAPLGPEGRRNHFSTFKRPEGRERGAELDGLKILKIILDVGEKAQLYALLVNQARGAHEEGELVELAAAWAVIVVIKLREAVETGGEKSEAVNEVIAGAVPIMHDGDAETMVALTAERVRRQGTPGRRRDTGQRITAAAERGVAAATTTGRSDRVEATATSGTAQTDKEGAFAATAVVSASWTCTAE